ncbi:MAG: alanine racemase [Deltaproteobacteria bacterium]|jgi:alanine racemase|nr:alanine racemase [Deltaproteobacteria bacterium]
MPDELTFNQAEIDLGALKANYQRIRSLNPLKPLMAVVKGDAYGHGLVECARALVEAGAKDLGVLDVVEGLALKKANLGEVDVHVLAGLQSRTQIEAAIEAELVVALYSLQQIQAVENLIPKGVRARAYLKIDTGMGRLGLPWWEVPAFLPTLVRPEKFAFRGLMTHLATVGDQPSRRQLDRFREVVKIDQSLGLTLGQHSVLASPGLLAYPGYDDYLPRVGLLMYGANPLAGTEAEAAISPNGQALLRDLRPVMKFTSRIIQTRTVRTGESLSYDRTFVAQKDMKVAVLPVGYVHGLSRRQSNRGHALVNGQVAPLIGRVCMNLSLFDVTRISGVNPGQRAVLLGESGEARITAEEAAKWQDTSAYETFCLFGRLNQRLFR